MKRFLLHAALASVAVAAPLDAAVTIRSSPTPPTERVAISQLVFAPSGSDRDWRYHADSRPDRDIGQSFNATSDLHLDTITLRVASNDTGSLNAPYRLLILSDLVYAPGEIDAGTEIRNFTVLSEQAGRLPATAFAPLSYVTFDIDDVFLPGDAQYAFFFEFDSEASQRLVKLKASSGSSYPLGDSIERNFGTGTGDVRRGSIFVGPVTTSNTPRNDLVFILQTAIPEPASALLSLLAGVYLIRPRR